MTDSNATERICELLAERGIDYKLRRASATSARETVFFEYEKDGDWATAEYAVTVPLDGYGTLEASNFTPEQAIAAMLGSDDRYDAGFASGIQAVFQQLEGIESYEELQDLIAEYWGEGEGNDER
ncbi:MAG: hypothetical protein IJG88_00695 [Eggerthellaceae bacterium]|nr:hypothetical protein [Eggerthellaceae bacterium]